ncbi:hypothetical protein CASFOL_020138 [Castilleja foliolosa]|uniref:CCT domain-containing protein n=1 Tax=Castilleja foliolosa TaxID=1961234 RepID=A0ABD3D3J5_9LAMI
MSSDLFIFENSFFSDPFTDPIQEINNPIDETNSFNRTPSAFLSSSPPRAELESLSLSEFEKTEYSVKTEHCQLNFDSFSGFENCFSPHSFDGAYETAVKFMQKSYSSNCFENNQNFMFRPLFDSVLESRDLQNQILSSPESGSSAGGQMRRVCSTGDLQNVKTNMETRNVLSSNPLCVDEANFKVGRYSAEEKKERIDRYRAKRTQRNFNKTIKYACRKTLADSRPRVRGRFARNDEACEVPKASMFHRYKDDLWIDGFDEEAFDGMAQRRTFFNISGSANYQNYNY